MLLKVMTVMERIIKTIPIMRVRKKGEKILNVQMNMKESGEKKY